MNHPVISAKHVGKCLVQKGCHAAPTPLSKSAFPCLLVWTHSLDHLTHSPGFSHHLCANDSQYMFSAPAHPRTPDSHSTAYWSSPPGYVLRHLKLTLSKWIPALASPQAFALSLDVYTILPSVQAARTWG